MTDHTQHELEEFRKQWKIEVESKRSPIASFSTSRLEHVRNSSDAPKNLNSPHLRINQDELDEPTTILSSDQFEPLAVSEESSFTAMQYYEEAIERERQGALSDSLILYRKAFKLDPTVDNLYRKALQTHQYSNEQVEVQGTSLEEQGYAKFVQTTHDYEPGNLDVDRTESFDASLTTMAALHLPISTTDETSVGLAHLPDELLYMILRYTMLDSPRSYTALSLTCQKFLLVLQDAKIWHDLCLKTYRTQVYKSTDIPLQAASEEEAYRDRLDNECEATSGKDWQRLFIEKPRIRVDGIYIATCHYTRPGVREESLVWTAPVFLVTYYRFLRFFPDGRCLCLLTTSEPREVVHEIHPDSKLRGLQRGTWCMTITGDVSIEANGPSNYLFFMELKIKSSSRGRQNKLSWTRFFGIHPQSAEITNFNLKNDKSYYYSRVKSYNTR